MTKPYEISDEDVEAVLRYMKLHVSKNSTLEDARKKLEGIGSDLHKLAVSEPERFFNIKKKIDKHDQSQ